MDYRDMGSTYDDDPLYDPRVGLSDSRRDRERERENFLYYRDRRRERSRERYRERGRDRSLIRVPRERRERERDYRYERSEYDDYRYEEYDADYHSERNYESRSYDREIRDRDRDRERERERDRDRTSWREEQPNNTIMLRNLAQHITEEHIRAEVLPLGVPIIDVRLMRKKDTGTSRGFAFVEFQNMSDATRWMEQKQGSLSFSDGTKCSMHYSMPRPDDHNLRANANKSDWSCSKCGAHNFKRREYCFKCNISREESENIRLGDGHDEVGTIPCNTLLLRNLDVLTLEDKILGALQEVSSLPIKNIRIAKDTLTNTSRGFCYVELNSTHECTQLVDTLTAMSPPLTIEGRQVAVSYSRQSLSSLTSPNAAGMANSAIAAAQWSNQKVNVHSGSTDYIQDSSQANTSQTYYAAGQTNSDFNQSTYDSQYYQNYDYSNYDNTSNGSSQADSTNAAAAVALNAMQQVQAVKHYQQQQQHLQQQIIAQMQQPKKEGKTEERLAHEAQQWSQQQDKKDDDCSSTESKSSPDVASYPVPDVSTYQYDESSGYYYDPLTSLYYDANSQYYYNAQTQQFLYWDAEKRSYLPAPTSEDGSAANMATNLNIQNKEKPKKEKDNKQDRVKIAKKIAKDMEKWAKTLNQKKEGFKQGFVPIGQFPTMLGDSKPSPTADAGYAMLEKRTTAAERVVTMEVVRKKQTEEKALMPPPPPKGSTKASNLSIVAAYGSESDSESEDDDTNLELKLVDWSKLACLLCKRQFQTKEALTRHQQISDLHKQNLEALQRNKLGDSEGDDMEKKERDSKYRDRAKERREKYGEPEPPKSNKLREKYYQVKQGDYEQPTKSGIGSENIGNKMLKAMGWTEGTGLGRKNQGIVDPIAAQRRAAAAGLGMKGSTFIAAPGDTYKEAVKKLTQARYSEIE